MVTIRPAEEIDFLFFLQIKSSPDNMFWTGHLLPPSKNQLLDFFQKSIDPHELADKRTIFMICKEADPRDTVGYMYFDPIDRKRAEISIAVLDRFSGHGYGKEAILEICRVIKERGWQTVLALIREDNKRSQNLFNRCGFAPTGKITTRQIDIPPYEIVMKEYCKYL